MTNGVRMTKCNVGRMIRTQTGSANCHTMGVTFPACEIEYVAHNYVLVRIVRAHPIGWMNGFIVKTFQVDGVRAVDRQSACIDIAAHRPDQAKILVLVIMAE